MEYVAHWILVWIIIALPAVLLSILLYWRFLMPRAVRSHRQRRRRIVAGIAAGAWLANFVWPVCYGDGKSYDIKVCVGLLQFHGGAIVTGGSLVSCSYYEFVDGLCLSHGEYFSFATRSETAAFMPWSMELLPMYRDLGSGFAWHIPLWPLFAMPIACWLVEGRRCQRTVKHNLCANCRYNLTGVSRRCPECGAAIERVAEHASAL